MNRHVTHRRLRELRRLSPAAPRRRFSTLSQPLRRISLRRRMLAATVNKKIFVTDIQWPNKVPSGRLPLMRNCSCPANLYSTATDEKTIRDRSLLGVRRSTTTTRCTWGLRRFRRRTFSTKIDRMAIDLRTTNHFREAVNSSLRRQRTVCHR